MSPRIREGESSGRALPIIVPAERGTEQKRDSVSGHSEQFQNEAR